MSNLDARITLQRSRFNLIEEAAAFDDTDASRLTRHLVMTRLERNWSRNWFQEEHENLCLSKSEILSDLPYVRERIYECCQAFYVFSRAKLANEMSLIH